MLGKNFFTEGDKFEFIENYCYHSVTTRKEYVSYPIRGNVKRDWLPINLSAGIPITFWIVRSRWINSSSDYLPSLDGSIHSGCFKDGFPPRVRAAEETIVTKSQPFS